MLRKTSILMLTTVLMTLSITSFCQTKSTSPELKKIASNLIECYYLTKASTMTSSTDCISQLKEGISGLTSLLQSKVDQNKNLITQKIGADNFEEVQTYIKRSAEYAESNEELTTEKKGSLMLWISLWKSVIEGIFIKLKR